MSDVKLSWESFCEIIRCLEYISIKSCGIYQKCAVWYDDENTNTLSLYEYDTGVLHEFDSDMNEVIILSETGYCTLITDMDKSIQLKL
jgi:hypothetical protein